MFTYVLSIKFLVFTTIILCIVSGCGDPADKKIPRTKMVQIYADVLIISNSLGEVEKSPEYAEQLDSVLSVHGVDRELFNATLEYFQQEPKRWKDLIDRVVLELENRRDQLRESSANRSSS